MSSTKDLIILEEGEPQHVQDVEAEAIVEYAKIGSKKNADLNSAKDIGNLEKGEMHHSQENVDILEASSCLYLGG